MPHFNRYIGIDYSGAETADSSCKGIRVFMAEGANEPAQVLPPPSPRRYWTRRGLTEWLREELDRDIPTLVGIDHAFSFPLAYFEKYRLSSDWQDFLEDFRYHWPTDEEGIFIDLIRDGHAGRGSKRVGDNRWLRLTEAWTATAKSVFSGHTQRILTNRRKAILKGTAPAWENHISYYPEKIPKDFAKDFRKFRNTASSHVSHERSALNLSDFYDKYHKYLGLLYHDIKSWWGRMGEEFPELNEITAFSVLIKDKLPSQS